MSYLVLARKYRPQTFDEIVGQEHVTQTLQNAIAAGRLHHAFLFTGARGVGKTTAARILAKCLSCVNAPTATPCNVCDACREITSGSSVDVQEIDAASNNGVDNIRELRDAIRYAPVRGKKKVYILDEVHMLSTRRLERAAQDARGAAAARHLRLRDDRSAQAAGHDPVARAALRLQAGAAAAHRRAPDADLDGGEAAVREERALARHARVGRLGA